MRAEVNGVERPVHLLDSYLRKADPGNSNAVDVMLGLFKTCMLKVIKRLTNETGEKIFMFQQ